MSGFVEERRAILRWFQDEANRHPRSDYAAWCVYFKNQLATGQYKDAEYWNKTGLPRNPPETGR